MSIFEHNRRARIYNPGQHPLKHTLEDFGYTNEALPGVSNIEGALDYVLAVLYPQSKTAVATPAALPLVGNTINDMRVVQDDGDGKAASYRWEQREGEASPSWHKIYDMDWGSDSILQAFFLKTQDIYVHRLGYDDLDANGDPLTGINAGQHIYGGRSANTHLNLHANSGDGVGAQTGFIQMFDHARPSVDSTWSLGTTAERWLKVWTDELTSGTLTLTGGSITDSSGAISFADENLSTTGSITGATLVGTTSATIGGTLSLASGSITDTSGTIDFDDENLVTTGGVVATSVDVGTLSINPGSITDSSGSISFDNENLSTTGTLSAGNTTVTRLDSDNLRLDGNTVSVLNLNGSLNLVANGTGVIDLQSAATTLGITATGTVAVTGQLNIDNLRLDGNTLSSTNVNGNIVIDPNGTGLIELGSTIYPATDSSFDIGQSGNVWNKLWLDGAIGDGSTEITSATLQSLRDINVGVAAGMTLFWDGSKWVASAPDTEIDHGTISGLGDDDHTQYLLLAGRAGGQSIIGGTAASNNLTLESTSHGTKGKILTKDVFAAFTDASYSGSWAGTDLGGSSNRFRHVYTAGEFFGLRLENLGADPSPSVQNVGRLFWHTGEASVKVDTGLAIQKVGSFRYEEDTSWDGSTTVKNVTVSGLDATKALWQIKDNTNDFRIMYLDIKATSTTNVRITVNVPLPAGSYRLIGIQ